MLDLRFIDYAEPLDARDPHYGAAIPFATTLGPSVYRCICGKQFGDPAEELTDDALKALADARSKHFHDVYRAKAESWYPAKGTLHYNLHRAVQRVMKERFTDATEFSEAMVPAVAAYLLDDAKGFIFDPALEGFIRATTESYLTLRRAGQKHPEGVLTLAVKAAAERSLLRA